MSISLPKPIERYFAADRTDGAAVARCFTESAVVVDEGNTYEGRPAIAKWKNDASTKYEYTVDPYLMEEREGTIVVTSHLEGNFPGSPVDLHYHFTLDGDLIARLEVLP